mmetsp:Transcript_5563/g.8308  ORF Transcript_5563/g.8308 Transcript_5563/m.8308 type:complete len:109 (-) Transcript_5563:3220-3546(-)
MSDTMLIAVARVALHIMIIKTIKRTKDIAIAMPSADQRTTGIKNVIDVRFRLYILNFSERREGSSPLLYFIATKILLGMKRIEIKSTLKIPMASAIPKQTLNNPMSGT